MRISGLASGIDTESIIRDMMAAKRIPLDKITQKKQYLEWQLDSYRDVNKDIRSMRDNLLNMTLQSTYMAKNVSVSNENAVSIKANNATGDFSGSIEIKQLATSANFSTEGLETKDGTKVKADTKISELGATGRPNWLTIAEGEEKSVGFNSPGAVGKKIKITEDMTIKDVISEINKETGVNAFFDEHTGKIAMTSKETGFGKIQIDGKEVGNTGRNAIFTFNGLETKRPSNTFSINGFEVTLKEVTDKPITFSSTTDTDKVFDSIKQFVDDYNKLITDLNSKIREPKYRDFAPLSAEQKADMKDKEIELWEEKAMSGTLKNDPTLQRLLSDMRTALSTATIKDEDDNTINLASLGITTSKDYMSNGLLEIDEEKLRAKIAENPDQVYELFGKAPSSKDANDGGVIHSIRDSMKIANDTISQRAGNAGSGKDSFTLGRNLKDMDKQIERFQERLKKSEEALWRQFSAMEQAMNRANAQAQQLMNGLGGM